MTSAKLEPSTFGLNVGGQETECSDFTANEFMENSVFTQRRFSKRIVFTS